MIEVSKKIANSKIEWRIKNLQLIVTNLFRTNNPQNDPLNGQKYKKNQFSQLWDLKETLGFHKDLKPICSPWSEYSPHLWYPKNSPKTPPKSPLNPQNLKKSNFSALGLGRHLRFSRVLQSHSSPNSEYYPRLYSPPKIPLPSYLLILHKFPLKRQSDPNCAPCHMYFLYFFTFVIYSEYPYELPCKIWSL